MKRPDRNLKLSSEILQEWKEQLDHFVNEQLNMKGYSKTLSDEEWISEHEGESVQEFIDNELESFE